MTTELTTGADRNGFDPFPGGMHCPGQDSIPGDMTYWKPYWSDVQIVYNYAAQVFNGLKDKSLLKLLGKYGIGDRT